MGWWAKSVLIFNAMRTHGQQSIRSLADRTGLSKSSVHRHLQAMDRRDRYPESSLWETEAGRPWLIRLLVATLFVFGRKRRGGSRDPQRVLGASSPGCACRMLAQRLANCHAHAGASPPRDYHSLGVRRHPPWRDTPDHRGRGRDLFAAHDVGV